MRGKESGNPLEITKENDQGKRKCTKENEQTGSKWWPSGKYKRDLIRFESDLLRKDSGDPPESSKVIYQGNTVMTHRKVQK